jgi:hypothetical protein
MRYTAFLLTILLCISSKPGFAAAEPDADAFELWGRVTSSSYFDGKDREAQLSDAFRRQEDATATMQDLMTLAWYDGGNVDARYRVADLILSKGSDMGYSFREFGENPLSATVSLLSTTNGDCAEGYFTCLGDKRGPLLKILRLDDKPVDEEDDTIWRERQLQSLLSDAFGA